MVSWTRRPAGKRKAATNHRFKLPFLFFDCKAGRERAEDDGIVPEVCVERVFAHIVQGVTLISNVV